MRYAILILDSLGPLRFLGLKKQRVPESKSRAPDNRIALIDDHLRREIQGARGIRERKNPGMKVLFPNREESISPFS